MSWSMILGGYGFTKKFPILPRGSDTIFSPLSDNVIKKKIDLMLRNKRPILTLDTNKTYANAIQGIAKNYGVFMTNMENSTIIRGNLELVKTNVSHPTFGEGLDLFTISNPLCGDEPIFIYFNVSQIKEAGIFGEAVAKKVFRNHNNGRLEAKASTFFREDIEARTPTTMQDITDFDEALARRIHLRSNITAIRIGGSKSVSSLQKLWFPSVSGMSIKGQVEGINSYSLVDFRDDGSYVKEKMDYFVKHFQPQINEGVNRFSLIDFNLTNTPAVKLITNPQNRSIFEGGYISGFRANTGTVISGRRKERTLNSINSIWKSPSTDYTNILDGIDVPTNLESQLKREKMLTLNLRYLLFCLRVLPVSYSIQDIKEKSPQQLRMGQAFAKLSPYMLSPSSDEVIVPQKMRDIHLRAVELFNKDNNKEVQDYIEDNNLLR